MSTIKRQQDDFPLWVKFLTAGTAACIADLATFPLDTAKVRMQVTTLTLDNYLRALEKNI